MAQVQPPPPVHVAGEAQRYVNNIERNQFQQQVLRVQRNLEEVGRELEEGVVNNLDHQQQRSLIKPHADRLHREVVRLKELAEDLRSEICILEIEVQRLQPPVNHAPGGIWKSIKKSVLTGDTNPADASIILVIIVALIVYLISGLIAAIAANIGWLVWFSVCGGLCCLGVPGLLWWNRKRNRFADRNAGNVIREYSANRANTCWTSFFIFFTLTIMYGADWFQQSQTKQISETYQSLDKISFPAVAILEQKNWSAQATLSTTVSSKCFLGYYNESASRCDGSISYNATSSCNCADSWDTSIQSLSWQGANYRFRNFRSDPTLTSKVPTSMMLLQVFFTYNASQNLVTEGTVASPGLSLAVYDQNLSLEGALQNNLTTLTDINALGVSSVQLDIRERVLLSHSSFSKYNVGITSIPSMQLVCDTSSNPDPPYACVTSIYLRAPNFMKTIETEDYELGWTDIVAYAGAFISFVQIISWMLSGLFCSP